MGLHSEKGTLKSRLFLIHGCRNATPWLGNGNCLITQSQNSIHGWLKTVVQKVNRTFLWKRWSPLWENSKTSSKRRRSWWKICKKHLANLSNKNLYTYKNKIGHHVGIDDIYLQSLETLCVIKIRLFRTF